MTFVESEELLIVAIELCCLSDNSGWGDRKSKMAILASHWLRHFQLLFWNCWTQFKETGQEARSEYPLQSLYFSGRTKRRWPPWPLIYWGIFDFSETAKRNSIKLEEARYPCILPSLCFSGRSEKQNGTATRNSRNLTGSKISPSYAIFFFGGGGGGLIRKIRWRPDFC